MEKTRFTKIMKAEYLIKILVPTFLIFALLVWLTIAHIITGFWMYLLWIAGFVVANLWVTRVTAQRSYRRLKKKREAEKKKENE